MAIISEAGSYLLSVLQCRWAAHIVVTIHRIGPQRFNALKRSVTGISAKMLADRLELLIDNGLVTQQMAGSDSDRFDYALTIKGGELAAPLEELIRIAEGWDTVPAAPLV